MAKLNFQQSSLFHDSSKTSTLNIWMVVYAICIVNYTGIKKKNMFKIYLFGYDMYLLIVPE